MFRYRKRTLVLEIVTIAASESGDPVRGIHRATNSVIWRIGTFYLASIFIVVALTITRR